MNKEDYYLKHASMWQVITSIGIGGLAASILDLNVGFWSGIILWQFLIQVAVIHYEDKIELIGQWLLRLVKREKK